MITEDYCSFEVAQLLKEKGFDAECRAAYTNYGKLFTTQIQQYVTNVLCSKGYLWDCVTPTHQMAMKWLREVHNVYIDISIYVITENILKYNINVYYKKHKNDSMYLGIHLTKECSKYEEAVEVALKYSLENLI